MRLTDSDLLRDLDKPEFAAVRAAFVPRHFPKGRQVYAPREARNSLFIVAQGRARVYLSYKDKEFTMAILDVGDVYTTHTRASVEALDDLTILTAELAAVRRFLADMPALTSSMVKVLGDLLSHAFSVIDGLAFLGKVKALRPQTDVIVVTGFATMETARESFRKGVYDFVAKPFKLTKILDAVRRIEKERGLVP